MKGTCHLHSGKLFLSFGKMEKSRLDGVGGEMDLKFMWIYN